MIELVESIIQTLRLTCFDCCQLLFTLFNTEERCKIVQETRRYLKVHAPEGVLDSSDCAHQDDPEAQPAWDHNTEQGHASLELIMVPSYRASEQQCVS